jgi:hypothetical protein
MKSTKYIPIVIIAVVLSIITWKYFSGNKIDQKDQAIIEEIMKYDSSLTEEDILSRFFSNENEKLNFQPAIFFQYQQKRFLDLVGDNVEVKEDGTIIVGDQSKIQALIKSQQSSLEDELKKHLIQNSVKKLDDLEQKSR